MRIHFDKAWERSPMIRKTCRKSDQRSSSIQTFIILTFIVKYAANFGSGLKSDAERVRRGFVNDTQPDYAISQ